MVKSAGYRIELGEIEAALYGHKGVREAAAVAVPDDVIGNRIRAFVARAAGHNVSDRELLVYCRQRLPHYMVPEIIDFCDELPKTSTGKVDRKLLLLVKESQ
jgi:acyl-coenzyme A synthetase/AMP-(fatty) acid ligase